MAQVKWSRPALLDLSRLHGFLQDKSPDAARKAIAAIRQGTSLIKTHPAAGRPAKGLQPEIRDLLVNFGASGCIVRYQLAADAVLILRIRHMREAGY